MIGSSGHHWTMTGYLMHTIAMLRPICNTRQQPCVQQEHGHPASMAVVTWTVMRQKLRNL
jgi:hypothetical protein